MKSRTPERPVRGSYRLVPMTLVLVRKLNHRNIELHHDTRGESVGVLLKDGEYRFLPWLGFIERDRATCVGKPVKLMISRVGNQGDFGATWMDVEPGKHVLGCRTDKRCVCGRRTGCAVDLTPLVEQLPTPFSLTVVWILDLDPSCLPTN